MAALCALALPLSSSSSCLVPKQCRLNSGASPAQQAPSTRRAALSPIKALKTGKELFPCTLPDGKTRQQVVEEQLLPSMTLWGPAVCRSKAADMRLNPHNFYRANADLFFWDLHTSRSVYSSGVYNPNSLTWIQGDMHTGNMGTFDDNTGQTVFDTNDFDQAYVANYLYDVYRLAASFALIGMQNGLKESDQRDFVETFAFSYADALNSFQGNNNDLTYQLTKDSADSVIGDLLQKVTKGNSSTRRKALLNKWTEKNIKGKRQFLEMENLAPVDDTTRSNIVAAMQNYVSSLFTEEYMHKDTYFKVVDVARRLNAGLGSRGTPRFYILIKGDDDGHRILDVKLQLDCAQKATIPDSFTRLYSHAERVGRGNKAMLYRADHHIGVLHFVATTVPASTGTWYSVREVHPTKGSLKTQNFTSSQIESMAVQYGKVLAADHSRAGGLLHSIYGPSSFKAVAMNDITMFGVKKFATELANFGIQYANQVATDVELFGLSVDSGKIAVAIQSASLAMSNSSLTAASIF